MKMKPEKTFREPEAGENRRMRLVMANVKKRTSIGGNWRGLWAKTLQKQPLPPQNETVLKLNNSLKICIKKNKFPPKKMSINLRQCTLGLIKGYSNVLRHTLIFLE